MILPNPYNNMMLMSSKSNGVWNQICATTLRVNIHMPSWQRLTIYMYTKINLFLPHTLSQRLFIPVPDHFATDGINNNNNNNNNNNDVDDDNNSCIKQDAPS